MPKAVLKSPRAARVRQRLDARLRGAEGLIGMPRPCRGGRHRLRVDHRPNAARRAIESISIPTVGSRQPGRLSMPVEIRQIRTLNDRPARHGAPLSREEPTVRSTGAGRSLGDRFGSRRLALRSTIAVLSSFASGANPSIVISTTKPVADARARTIAAPFRDSCCRTGTIGGYYTLSSTGVNSNSKTQKQQPHRISGDITRKLPRYPFVPATLLGPARVDQNYQGRGYAAPARRRSVSRAAPE